MGRLVEYVLELIFFLIVGKLLSAAVRSFFGSSTFHVPGAPRASTSSEKRQTVRGETARDPVCGMFVSTELSHRMVVDGKTLHFCSQQCLESYKKNPVAEPVEP